MNQLERLRARARPLASATTIRATPAGDPEKDGQWTVDPALIGVWICAERGTEGSCLAVEPLGRGSPCKGEGFLVLVPDRSWVAPLLSYLRSEIVRDWLDQNAERRSDRWVLEDQVVRWIPVPATLFDRLSRGEEKGGDPVTTPLSDSSAIPSSRARRSRGWRTTTPPRRSGRERRSSSRLRARSPSSGGPEQPRLADRRRRARVLGQGARYPSAVGARRAHAAPGVTLHGTLPPHIPIARLDRVKAPEPGILLATELGPYLRIASGNRALLDMIWSQLEGDLASDLERPHRPRADSQTRGARRGHGQRSPAPTWRTVGLPPRAPDIDFRLPNLLTARSLSRTP